MIFSALVASLASLAVFSEPVKADLRITANHHSFGGVNYPMLQFFTPQHRDDTIREIVKSGARVMRLFSKIHKCAIVLGSDYFSQFAPTASMTMYEYHGNGFHVNDLTHSSPKVS